MWETAIGASCTPPFRLALLMGGVSISHVRILTNWALSMGGVSISHVSILTNWALSMGGVSISHVRILTNWALSMGGVSISHIRILTNWALQMETAYGTRFHITVLSAGEPVGTIDPPHRSILRYCTICSDTPNNTTQPTCN